MSMKIYQLFTQDKFADFNYGVITDEMTTLIHVACSEQDRQGPIPETIRS